MFKNFLGVKNYFLFLFLISLMGYAPIVLASPEKEFIMSCTYGVLAGTLIGAASLAFTEKPGDNLQRVARGASLGLYAGIALGYYTVYYLPDKIRRQEENRLNPDHGFYQPNGNKWNIFPIANYDNERQVGSMGLGLLVKF